MYKGDRARKENLVNYGFRLPSALDNRPLRFDEFERLLPQTIFVSATPADYESKHTGQVVEQLVRPTGLVDPTLDVRPAATQVDDLLSEIRLRVERNERVLVTTLTKRMAEDLTDYLAENGVKVRYLHSDIDTVERVEIIRDLRLGEFDVLVGINLLREGLDIPEVSLVAILDADKEGFLRSERSLIQTIGRAARHINGMAILYADVMTDSMKAAIGETDRRRTKQVAWNEKMGITPIGVQKRIKDIIEGVYDPDEARKEQRAAQAKAKYEAMPEKDMERELKALEKQMLDAARTSSSRRRPNCATASTQLKQQMFGVGCLEPVENVTTRRRSEAQRQRRNGVRSATCHATTPQASPRRSHASSAMRGQSSVSARPTAEGDMFRRDQGRARAASIGPSIQVRFRGHARLFTPAVRPTGAPCRRPRGAVTTLAPLRGAAGGSRGFRSASTASMRWTG